MSNHTRITKEDAQALGKEMHQIVGTREHKAKWVERVMNHYGYNAKQAKWVYDEAVDQQRSNYRFPRFVDALNAQAGRLHGVISMPEAGKKDTLEAWNK